MRHTTIFLDSPSGLDKDHWYWSSVDATFGPAFTDLDIELQNVSSESHTASLRGLLKGYSAFPNHHTIVSLNTNIIDDHVFSTGSDYLFSADIQQADLLEGSNTLRVACPLDGIRTNDSVLINWIEVDYYKTYFAEDDRLFFEGDLPGPWEFQVDGYSSNALEAFRYHRSIGAHADFYP